MLFSFSQLKRAIQFNSSYSNLTTNSAFWKSCESESTKGRLNLPANSDVQTHQFQEAVHDWVNFFEDNVALVSW